MVTKDEPETSDRFRLRRSQSVGEFLDTADFFICKGLVMESRLREWLQACFVVDLARSLQESKTYVQRRDWCGGIREYCASASAGVLVVVVVFRVPAWDFQMFTCVLTDEQVILPCVAVAIGRGPDADVNSGAGKYMVIYSRSYLWG